MKKLALVLALILGLGGISLLKAQELPCLKCHTSANPLPDKIKKSGAKSAAELVEFIRKKSPKQALHKTVTDEDIKKAFEQFGKK